MAASDLPLRSSTFGGRLLGALRLDADTYEDVEHDGRALGQALAVLIVSSVGNGLGAVGTPQNARALLTGTLLTLAGWLTWSSIIFVVGSKLLPEPQTEASVGQLLRTTGFAAAPGVFGIVGLAGAAGPPLHLFVTLWMFAAMVVAVRQALDFTSAWRAFGVVAIGYVPYLALIGFAAALADS